MPLFAQAHGPPDRRRLLGALLGAALALTGFAGAASVRPAVARADAPQTETRAAFIVDLAEALCLQPDNTAAQKYSDLPASDPDYGLVMAATDLGWIWGFPDGTFRPKAGLTREQMAKIEIIALGLQPQAEQLANQRPAYADWDMIGHWAWGDVNEATSMGLLRGFTDQTFGPASTFTTAEAQDVIAQLAAYLLKPPTVTGVVPSQGTDGTEVTVSGTGFCHATGVSFGNTAATSYDVKSVSDLIAVAPPGSGTVDVSVTTGKGTSPAVPQDHYTYIVPESGAGPSPTPPGPTDVALVGAHYDSQDGDFTLEFSGPVSAASLQDADFVLSDGAATDTLGTMGTVSGSGTASLTTPLSGDQLLTLGDEIQLAAGQGDVSATRGADLVQTAPVPITGIPALTSAEFLPSPEGDDLPQADLYLTFTEPVQGSGTVASDVYVTNGDSLGTVLGVSGSGTNTLDLTLQEGYAPDPFPAPGDSVALDVYQHDITDGAGMAVQPTAPVPVDFAAILDASYDPGSHQLTIDFFDNVTATSVSAADFVLAPGGDSLGTVVGVDGSGTQTLTLTLSGESLSGADTISLAQGQEDIVDAGSGLPAFPSPPVDISGFPTNVTGATYSQSTGVLTVTFSSWVYAYSVAAADFTLGSTNAGDTLGSGVASYGSPTDQITMTLTGAVIQSGDTLTVASGQYDMWDLNYNALGPGTPVPITVDP